MFERGQREGGGGPDRESNSSKRSARQMHSIIFYLGTVVARVARLGYYVSLRYIGALSDCFELWRVQVAGAHCAGQNGGGVQISGAAPVAGATLENGIDPKISGHVFFYWHLFAVVVVVAVIAVAVACGEISI